MTKLRQSLGDHHGNLVLLLLVALQWPLEQSQMGVLFQKEAFLLVLFHPEK